MSKRSGKVGSKGQSSDEREAYGENNILTFMINDL